MDTVVNLKAKIAAYLDKTAGDLTVNSVDLGLDAINRAHQWALMKYDFELAKVFVTLTVDITSGGVYSPATLYGTSTLVTIKKILKGYLSVNGGGYRPVDFVHRSSESGDLRRAWEGRPWTPSQYDPASLFDLTGTYLPQVFQLGGSLFVYPALTSIWGTTNPISLAFDAVRYFPDYPLDTTSTDFLLQFGDDFLFWDAVCRLNKYFKEFVPRQEGNLSDSDIESERKQAWLDLIAWDAGLFSGSEDLNLD